MPEGSPKGQWEEPLVGGSYGQRGGAAGHCVQVGGHKSLLSILRSSGTEGLFFKSILFPREDTSRVL